jgi:hypothetical protein
MKEKQSPVPEDPFLSLSAYSPLFGGPDFGPVTCIGFPKLPFDVVPGPLLVIVHYLPSFGFLGL